MTAYRIPLAAKPSQVTTVQLGSQNCRIKVYQKRTGLFVDIDINNTPIIRGVLCRDRVWLVRRANPIFAGDMAFIDTQGTSDPEYSGLADRFRLVWEF